MTLLRRIKPWLEHRYSIGITVCVAMLLMTPSVFVGFATDDHNFRLVFQGAPGAPELVRPPWQVFSFFAERGPENREALLERGVLPWWTGDGFSGSFFRPLSSLSHYVDWRLFGEHAWPMHVHSLLLFALMLVGLGILYRRLHGAGWIAGLALLLYAVDDARGMDVGWLSGRNTLMSAVFGVWAILVHDLWRRGRWRPGVVVAPLLWAMGLGSAEAGLGAAGFLAAYAVTVEPGPLWRRAVSLMPYAPVFFVWAAIYKMSGCGVHGSNGYIDPFSDPVLYLKGALEHLPVQLFGQFGVPDCVFYNVLPSPWQGLYWLNAAAFVGVFLALCLPVLRTEVAARFWALGMLLSLLPASATLPQDRLLVLASVGGAPLIALVLWRWRTTLEAGLRPSRALAWMGGLLVLIHLMISPFTFLITSCAVGGMEQAAKRANASMPMNASLTEETIVIANAPTELMCLAVPLMRSSLRQPVPAHTLMLSTGNDTVAITRVDEHTLLLRTEGEMLNTPWANLFRRTSVEPLSTGWSRELAEVKIEALEASPGGSPRLTRFTFAEPLESSRLHFVTWMRDHYEALPLPAVGHTVELARRPFIPVLRQRFVEKAAP